MHRPTQPSNEIGVAPGARDTYQCSLSDFVTQCASFMDAGVVFQQRQSTRLNMLCDITQSYYFELSDRPRICIRRSLCQGRKKVWSVPRYSGRCRLA